MDQKNQSLQAYEGTHKPKNPKKKTENETRKTKNDPMTMQKNNEEIKRVSLRNIHFSAANFGKMKVEVLGILMMLQQLQLQIVESHQIAAIGGLHSNTVKVHHFLPLLHCCYLTTESTQQNEIIASFKLYYDNCFRVHDFDVRVYLVTELYKALSTPTSFKLRFYVVSIV